MIDLGHEYDLCCPSACKEDEKRVDYPTLYVRGKDLPELPSGEFYFIAKAKKIGERRPIDSKENQSCEIAVLAFKVKDEEKGKDEARDILDLLKKKLK